MTQLYRRPSTTPTHSRKQLTKMQLQSSDDTTLPVRANRSERMQNNVGRYKIPTHLGSYCFRAAMHEEQTANKNSVTDCVPVGSLSFHQVHRNVCRWTAFKSTDNVT